MSHTFDFLLAGQQAKKLLERLCEEQLPGCGLRQVELEILYFLCEAGAGDTASEILRAWHLSKAHISKSVDNLRRGGYILLCEDAGDHRLVHLRPTPSARALAGRYAAVRAAALERIFAGVTPEERAAVRRAAEKIHRNLCAELGDHPL